MTQAPFTAMSALNRELSIAELEDFFWKISNCLAVEFGSFESLYPNRNYKELVDEILPMIMFGKFVLGQPANWSRWIKIHPQIEKLRQSGDNNFDAKFRFGSFQPEIDGDEKAGFIEVTRVWKDALQEKLSYRYMAKNGPIAIGDSTFEDIGGKVDMTRNSASTDPHLGATKFKENALNLLEKKVGKTYQPGTTLIISSINYPDASAPILALDDQDFIENMAEIAKEHFDSACLVGTSLEPQWLCGRAHWRS